MVNESHINLSTEALELMKSEDAKNGQQQK